MKVCDKCGKEYEGSFCPDCGEDFDFVMLDDDYEAVEALERKKKEEAAERERLILAEKRAAEKRRQEEAAERERRAREEAAAAEKRRKEAEAQAAKRKKENEKASKRANKRVAKAAKQESRRVRQLVKSQNKKNAADKRRYKRAMFGRAMRGIVFMLPIAIAIIIGFDVFMPYQGHVAEMQDSGFLGTAIFLYVAFWIAAIVTGVTLLVRMCMNEKIDKKGYVSVNRFRVGGWIVGALCAVLFFANFFQYAPKFGMSKITFAGGDIKTVKYEEKGMQITLPKSNQKTTKTDEEWDYYIDNVLVGWKIGGNVYKPGAQYTLSGWEWARAIYRADKRADLTVSVYNATVTLTICEGGHTDHSNDETRTFSANGTASILVGSKVTVNVSYSYSNSSLYLNDSSIKNGSDFYMNGHSKLSASSYAPSSSGSSGGGGGGCFVEGTMVTLADGSQRAVENLRVGDMLMIFNHETGEFDCAPLLVNVHSKVEAKDYEVITLSFEGGVALSIVDEHALFDKTLSGYEYLTKDNAESYIGHEFVLYSGRTAKLISASVHTEHTRIFNPVTLWHGNVIAGGLLTQSAKTVDIYEYDENMRIDFAALQRDIELYGIYTYDELSGLMTEQEYDLFPLRYYKAAVAKGEFSFEKLLELVRYYRDEQV